MEALLASYGSDEEDEAGRAAVPQTDPRKPSSLSLPTPSKLFASLPQPRKRPQIENDMFGTIPAPKKTKGRVQFRPPIDISALSEESDDKKKREIPKSENTIVVGKLVLPAPKNTSLGAALGSGGGRRSQVLDAGKINTQVTHEETPGPVYEPTYTDNYPSYEQNTGDYQASYEQNTGDFQASYEQNTGDYQASYEQNAGENYSGVENYAYEASYGVEEDPVEKALKQERRRGKDEPVKFLEVKQSDLTANRPRVDQLQMTGIAFGSLFDNKGEEENKPSKLHKRKHQIGSLYHDMRQKEFELMERRAKGQVSKSQTQAKYGW